MSVDSQSKSIIRCDGCQYWINDPEENYRAVSGIGECKKAVELWDATEWVKNEGDGYTERLVKPELADQMSFVQDGSDYSASLWTKPEFFCAHHQAISAI